MSNQDSDFNPTVGWEVNSEELLENENLDIKLIKLANKKLSLEQTLRHYNITLENTYNSTGWTFKAKCPFKDHNDKTPSFGFNPNLGIFHCFGCHRGGQTVEFISYFENRDKIKIAKNILKNLGGYSSEEMEEISNFDIARFQKQLFDYAKEVQLFVKENPAERIKYAKAVTWNLDVFIKKNFNDFGSFSEINLDELEARLSKLKEQLKLFGDE